jgi:hypothetical protein
MTKLERDGWLSWRVMGGNVSSAHVCHGSTLCSNPDIPQKWATSGKKWPTHSSPQKKFKKKKNAVAPTWWGGISHDSILDATSPLHE